MNEKVNLFLVSDDNNLNEIITFLNKGKGLFEFEKDEIGLTIKNLTISEIIQLGSKLRKWNFYWVRVQGLKKTSMSSNDIIVSLSKSQQQKVLNYYKYLLEKWKYISLIIEDLDLNGKLLIKYKMTNL
jgi:hypothetical protein